MPISLSGRNFLKLLDYTPDEIRYLLRLSKQFKNLKLAGTPQIPRREEHRSFV